MLKTVIACFSATGNSLFAAKHIKADRILTIGKDKEIDKDTEVLGLVFPVYCGTIPLPVRSFIDDVLAKRDNSNLKYIFGVLTYGKSMMWARSHLSRALQDAGCVLSYVDGVQMPDCYLPLAKKAVGKEKRDEMLSKAVEKLERIGNDIGKEKFELAGMGLSYRLIGRLMYNAAKTCGNRLEVGDGCTGCGICASSCPAGNISIADKKASIGSECLCCYACYHICPENAISFPGAVGQYVMPENMKGRYR